ncbi:hypothetical protein B0T26DRAFT_104190 [Lasiosphaeria miniovina]|uniref:Uncharacterized protein n=1 Tax=Lasiosphaeria miniovina TaxID=1954250 RepID=A0AA40E7F4_9PEZI|nr:uncharacterized protein B0T26DRAFT_104190 [Lasiosphaeria miniovina]KAK0726801.1 hypothetical protein B0T26DRAFT_104190 [Lasiosphaeria miniovina]
MSTTFPLASEDQSGTSAASPEIERSTKQAQAGCLKPDEVSILEDQENHGPALKDFRGTRCILTVRWGDGKFEYIKKLDDNSRNGRIEVSSTPNPQTGRITLIFDMCFVEYYPRQTTQPHENDRSLQYGNLNKAFYGQLPEGTPAFGDMRAESPEDYPSNLSTIPNSPGRGDQLSAVQDGAVDQQYQTSVDGGKGLKRSSNLEDVSVAGVKRQRLSDPENPAHKQAGSRDLDD